MMQVSLSAFCLIFVVLLHDMHITKELLEAQLCSATVSLHVL